jgi:hypothetical protein
MKKNLVLSCLAAGAAVLAASSTVVAKDNWLGTWKMNPAKSKFSPGPAPQGQTTTFEATADGIKLTSDGVSADGTARHTEYVSRFDGQDVPWTGNPNADTAAPKRIDDNSYENTYKKAGKTVMTARVVVSADGKTLTLTQTGKDEKGRDVSNTAVYDRQ